MRTWPMFLGLLAAVSPAGLAAESSRAVESTPENPLAAAKRELDALKANGNAAADQKGGLPGLAMPTLRTGETEAPRLPRVRLGKDTVTPQKKSGNWLIEAMEKKPEQEKGGARNASERSFLADDAETDVRLEAENSRPGQSAEGKNERLSAVGLNPLERFMGEWMTAKDLAVLLPNLAEAKRAEGARPADTASTLFSTGATTRDSLDEALGLRSVASQMKASPPRENPYLQAFDLPAPPMRAVAMPPSPASSQPMSTPILAAPRPPENAAAKTPVTDFTKPGADEKYFKQLKRF